METTFFKELGLKEQNAGTSTGLSFSSIQPILHKAKQQGLLTYDTFAMETTEFGKRFYNNLLAMFMSD